MAFFEIIKILKESMEDCQQVPTDILNRLGLSLTCMVLLYIFQL